MQPAKDPAGFDESGPPRSATTQSPPRPLLLIVPPVSAFTVMSTSVSGIRDTGMYLPFVTVAGVMLSASASGTAVAEAGHDLPSGGVACLCAGIRLFFLASAAEPVRYGAPWSEIAIWAPAGIVRPGC